MTRARDLADSADKDIAGTLTLDAVNASGEIIAASLDISGNIDVDGTTNLDVVDIDGAVDMASTLAVNNHVSVKGGQAYASSATNLSTAVSKKAFRMQGSSDASTSLYMGALTNDAQMYIQASNDGGTAADDIVLNPFGGLVGIGIGNASPPMTFTVRNGSANSDIVKFTGDGTGAGLTISTASTTRNDDTVIFKASDAFGEIVFKSDNTEVMRINTSKQLVIATGSDLITNSASGTTNTRIGTNAGDSIVASNAGLNNVLIGVNAGTALDSGDSNIAIGYHALKTEDDHANNIAIGAMALENQDAGVDAYNVAIGYNAGNDITDGLRNVIIGGIAGDQATTIDDCVIIGYNAGGNATMTGHDNVLVGKDAGQELVAGNGNVMVGRDAGQASNSAEQCVFIGEDAGFTNIGGDQNTFVGSDAGYLNEGGNGNTYIGKNSGQSMTSGSENSIIGSFNGNQDGLDIRTASNNIVLSDGDGEVSYFKNASGNTFIGNATIDPTATLEVRGTNPSAIRASGGSNTNNKVEIGYDSGSGKGAYIKAGSSGINTLQVYVDNTSLAAEFKGNGDFYSNDGTVHSLSDSRVKKDIADLTDGLDIVKQLKPRTFKFNGKATTLDDNRTKYGFIADEVMTVAPQYVSVDTQTIDDAEVDDFKSLSTTKMIPMLVKAIQELEARIATLEG